MNKSNSISASKFRILSFNPNSIGKLKAIRKKNANIILFSDTRISAEVEPIVRSEWGGKANFASFTSQARGVAIFFTKNIAIEIIEDSIFNDKSGNFTVLNFKYENFIITLGCIYMVQIRTTQTFLKMSFFIGLKYVNKHLILQL